MFALLKKRADGTSEFLVPAVSAELAMLLGRRWSETLGLTIIGVENLRDGTTRECFRFENGALVGESMLEGAGSCEDRVNDKKNSCP
jgi:hypothetical protein